MSLTAALTLAGCLLLTAFDCLLESLNLCHIKKKAAEENGSAFTDFDLQRRLDYTVETIRLNLAESVAVRAAAMLFIFAGPLTLYCAFINSLGLPFIPAGMLFFGLIVLASEIMDAPFDFHRTFRVERKHGYGVSTKGLWLSDTLKSAAVTLALSSVLSGAGLSIVCLFPNIWWLPCWLFFLCFSVFVMWISPFVIEPLFNKLTPVDDPELELMVRGPLERAGVKFGRIFMTDASKRTRHTNAYFTGVGSVKKIVIYDNLRDRLCNEEIAAVLAHEAGHWKKKHILKLLALMETAALAVALAVFYVAKSGFFSSALGIKDGGFFADVFMSVFLMETAMVALSPLISALLRRFEREADDFAVGVSPGNGVPLADALVKISRCNLLNFYPHPWYAALRCSHPPVPERAARLRASAAEPDRN